MVRNLKFHLPENSSLLDFLKDPTSSLTLHDISGWICIFRVKSPTSAAKRMDRPSSMTWTLPRAIGIGQGKKNLKNLFRKLSAGDPENLTNENTPLPSEVLPTLRLLFLGHSPQMSAEKWKARSLISLWDQSESVWARIHFSLITVGTGTRKSGHTRPISGVPNVLP